MLVEIKSYYWTGYSFERALTELYPFRNSSVRGVWHFPFLKDDWQTDYIEILEQLTAMERGLIDGQRNN